MCTCLCMGPCVGDVLHQSRAIKESEKRHSSGVKLSDASLMETWCELNMSSLLFFLSSEGAVTIKKTSIPLPLSFVQFKYLRRVCGG